MIVGTSGYSLVATVTRIGCNLRIVLRQIGIVAGTHAEVDWLLWRGLR
jgi:hypothetical protein